MGEKLAASREGIVRKSTWGTLRGMEKQVSVFIDSDEPNPYTKKETTRVDASSVFNKLGYDRCKSIID